MNKSAKSLGTLWILLILSCSSKSATENKDGGAKNDAAPSAKDAPGADTGKDLASVQNSRPDAATAYLPDPDHGVVYRLAIAGRYLYWSSGNHRIVRGSLDDLTTKVLFKAPGSDSGYIAIMDFAIDSTYAYIAYAGDNGDYDKRGVYRVALDGSAAAERLTSSPHPNVTYPGSIAVAGDDVFYHEAGAIRRVKTTGGEVTTMVQDRGSPYDRNLLVHQGYVYFTMVTRGSGNEDVYRVPVGAAVAVAVDGGSAGGMDGGGMDGGASAVPEKVSVVSGNENILLGRRVDQGYVYWSARDTAFRTDGNGAPKELFDALDLLRVQDTGIDYCLFPIDGVLYWGQGSYFSGDHTFRQAVDTPGTGKVFADMGFGDMVADADYLYGAGSDGIWRLKR
jgi:hypothetical protein